MPSTRWCEAALLPIVMLAWIAPGPWSCSASETSVPAPVLQPVQMRFAADAPPAVTNLIPVTLHAPPAIAWSQPEAGRADAELARGPWLRSEAPPPGTMTDIAPPDPATTRAPGWLADDKNGTGRDSAFSDRGTSTTRRGWLANSVNRLQARAVSAAEEAESDASLWDDERADDTRLDGDLWKPQGQETTSRNWGPDRTANDDRGAAVWEDTFARPTGATGWRNETDPLSTRSGEGNAMRPAFGATDDNR
ncbi:MAG: hypothetical protein K8T26_04785 [Lentisphaerae bacterium]|nr:hypothetical protein [Lentisphaerota bacterium]